MVVDTRYYDILQIKTDADELAIKKVLLLLLRQTELTRSYFAGVPASGYFGTYYIGKVPLTNE
jgi:hypothetical protein